MRKGEPGPKAKAGNGGTACRSLKSWEEAIQGHRRCGHQGLWMGSLENEGLRTLWQEGTGSKQEMEGEAKHVSMEDGPCFTE